MEYVTMLMKACCALLASTVGVLVTVVSLAMMMTSLDASMTWFTHARLLPLMYALPAITAFIAVHSLAKRYMFHVSTAAWVLKMNAELVMVT